jgi:hypothetical protein
MSFTRVVLWTSEPDDAATKTAPAPRRGILATNRLKRHGAGTLWGCFFLKFR